MNPPTARRGARAAAWVDGASRGNPGEAGFGLLIQVDGHSDEICGFLGRTTNNVAEYAGLIAALTLANRMGVDGLVVHSDSQLLVKQLRGEYRVKAPHLIPIFLRVMQLRRKLAEFEIRHIPRQENQDADRLANLAIDLRTPPPDWFRIEALSK